MNFQSPFKKQYFRFAFGSLVFLLFVSPIFTIFEKNMSLIYMNKEFAGYRYFASLSIVKGELQNVFNVQGFPMGILQHLIVAIMPSFMPPAASIFDYLEIFIRINLLVVYISSGMILFASWLLNEIKLFDKIILSFVSLAILPLTRYSTLLFSPDYWTFEIPYYIISTVGGIFIVRYHQNNKTLQINKTLSLLLAGLWIAIGFTHKPSLAGIGFIPIAGYILLSKSKVWIKAKNFILLFLSVILFLTIIILCYFRLDIWYFIEAMEKYISFLTNPGKLEYANIFDALKSDGTLYLRMTIILSLFACFALFIVSIFQINSRRKVIAIIILTLSLLVLLGHLYTILKRPAYTSFFDFMLYSLFLIPIALSIAPIQIARLRFLFCVGLLIYSAVFRQPILSFPYAVEPHNLARTVMENAQSYVKKIGKPIILFLPNGETSAATLEAIGLFHGQLGFKPPPLTDSNMNLLPLPDASIRQKLFPNTYLLVNSEYERKILRKSIESGQVILWGEVPWREALYDEYPELQLCLKHSNAVVREFEHTSLGQGIKVFVCHIES